MKVYCMGFFATVKLTSIENPIQLLNSKLARSAGLKWIYLCINIPVLHSLSLAHSLRLNPALPEESLCIWIWNRSECDKRTVWIIRKRKGLTLETETLFHQRSLSEALSERTVEFVSNAAVIATVSHQHKSTFIPVLYAAELYSSVYFQRSKGIQLSSKINITVWKGEKGNAFFWKHGVPFTVITRRLVDQLFNWLSLENPFQFLFIYFLGFCYFALAETAIWEEDASQAGIEPVFPN